MADYLISYVQAMELATWYRLGERLTLPARVSDAKSGIAIRFLREWRVDPPLRPSPNQTQPKPNR